MCVSCPRPYNYGVPELDLYPKSIGPKSMYFFTHLKKLRFMEHQLTCRFFHSILTTTLGGRDHCPQFTDGKTKA